MSSGGSGVIGYQPINISFTDNYWGGLEHNNQLCLLDGSVGEGSEGYWWYAMGSFGDFNGGIPGASVPVHQVAILYPQWLIPRLNCMYGTKRSSDLDKSFSLEWFFRWYKVAHILIQAGQENNVWGYHGLSSEPSFSFASLFKDGVLAVTVDVNVSADGLWTFQLPSQEAGTGYLLTIQSGEQSLEIQVTGSQSISLSAPRTWALEKYGCVLANLTWSSTCLAYSTPRTKWTFLLPILRSKYWFLFVWTSCRWSSPRWTKWLLDKRWKIFGVGSQSHGAGVNVTI